jgi:ABC-type nitrate/sulfonate/bicarbonate transport system substrate-binding protein
MKGEPLMRKTIIIMALALAGLGSVAAADGFISAAKTTLVEKTAHPYPAGLFISADKGIFVDSDK